MSKIHPPPRRYDEPSFVRGAAAGLLAGLVASFAMDRFQAVVTVMSPPSSGGEPATDKAANRVTKAVTGRKLAKARRPFGGQVVHYALGAWLGAIYGTTAEYRRDLTAGKGAPFGLAIALVLDEAAVPAVGLGKPPWRTDAGTHAYSAASHLVFGAVVEFIRSNARRLLRSPRERQTPSD